MPALAAPEARMGADAASDVHPWPEKHCSRSNITKEPGLRSRHQIGHHPARATTLWLAEDRSGRASPGAYIAFRISNARRHTSFSSVAIFPVIDDSIKIDIKESYVRTDTMRSAVRAASHVNTTEISRSALTPIPTGGRGGGSGRAIAAQNPERAQA